MAATETQTGISKNYDAGMIARRLISAHYPDLEGWRIDHVLIPGRASRTRAVDKLAKCRVASATEAWYSGLIGLDDVDQAKVESGLEKPGNAVAWVIEYNATAWQGLSREMREWLVDHELAHCIVGRDAAGETAPMIKPHDFEEHFDVFQRHGAVTVAAEHIIEIVQALLPGMPAKGRAKKSPLLMDGPTPGNVQQKLNELAEKTKMAPPPIDEAETRAQLEALKQPSGDIFAQVNDLLGDDHPLTKDDQPDDQDDNQPIV